MQLVSSPRMTVRGKSPAALAGQFPHLLTLW